MNIEKYRMLSIPMKTVESDCFSSYGYNEEFGVLDIDFNSGYYVYRYLNVPKDVVTTLFSDKKHGAFFNANIRNVYPCIKLRLSDVYAGDRHYEHLKIHEERNALS